MQLVRLHRLLGNQVPSQWSSFMHILQPSTLFRRRVSKQVQQLPAQEYTNQQKTASGPLKHELQNTRLQASASANAMNPATRLIEPGSKSVKQVHVQLSSLFWRHSKTSAIVARVHQSAVKPTSDNILTKGQIVLIPCNWIGYSLRLRSKTLNFIKLISQLNMYKININVFNKHNAHQSFWDVSWLRRWKNL